MQYRELVRIAAAELNNYLAEGWSVVSYHCCTCGDVRFAEGYTLGK